MPRFRMLPAVLALAAVTLVPAPSFAANKDMIQLQTQVQQLLDQVARLQQSNDERMGVQRDLIQQTVDSVNKMSQVMDGLQRQLRAQSEASGTGVQQVSGQVQTLNDSVDELKARLGRIEKTLGDLQSSQASMSARMDASGAGSAPASDSSAPPSGAPMNAAPITRGGKPSAAVPLSPGAMSASGGFANTAPTASNAPPMDDLYRTALGDFNGAKYTVAAAEFNDVIKYYPDANYAGNSYFYLGEIDYKAGRYAAAAKNYDRVGEQYPGNPKIPVAELRKGEALLALKQNDAGVRELRSLIQRYPNSQEASAARSRLSGMGVTVTPRTR